MKVNLRELLQSILTPAATILVLLLARTHWRLLRNSCVGQIARKINSSRTRFVFYLSLLVVLAVLPIMAPLLRDAMLSPEELAHSVAEFLKATTSALTFWIVLRLTPERVPTVIDDLNTASKEDLKSLAGIGPVLAERIIQYREQLGSFERIDDLKQVPGIGNKLFNQIKHHIEITVERSQMDVREKHSRSSGGMPQ